MYRIYLPAHSTTSESNKAILGRNGISDKSCFTIRVEKSSGSIPTYPHPTPPRPTRPALPRDRLDCPPARVKHFLSRITDHAVLRTTRSTLSNIVKKHVHSICHQCHRRRCRSSIANRVNTRRKVENTRACAYVNALG